MTHQNLSSNPKQKIQNIESPKGRVAVLTPGMGAVATTLFAGVEAIKRRLAKPIGSYTQMGTIRLGKRTENRSKLVKELVPLAELDQLVFGGWDIFPENSWEAASKAQVLDKELLTAIKEPLSKITPMSAVFDNSYIKNIRGPNVKNYKNKREAAELLQADIRNFMKENSCDRAVMVWCASTEIYNPIKKVHSSLAEFEKGLLNNDPDISPSQIYTYAALKERVPFINGSPNICVEIPAIHELAREMRTPICGSDYKTGQTLMKTIVAPGLRNRLLGVAGWYSTNILGNRDGEVLDDPGSFRSKEVSKKGVLEDILSAEAYPELYKDLCHIVKINYYPPRGDNKEGWDNIDIFGWLGAPMQIKINFLCRDSILAAPVALDLALFMDLAKRADLYGIQEWPSFYFKAPLTAPGIKAENDLSIQLLKLENTLRFFSKEELINHLGMVHYGVDEEELQ
ncbi:MAG: inositol-3-phosphate synthase [Oligoflexia bacterium]|nr:inositol-3-phosphate synthase [Oligoflexia bacterium]MBF0365184.1 inositol-3-phosphate synthase [Oligoflexia bacterium]